MINIRLPVRPDVLLEWDLIPAGMGPLVSKKMVGFFLLQSANCSKTNLQIRRGRKGNPQNVKLNKFHPVFADPARSIERFFSEWSLFHQRFQNVFGFGSKFSLFVTCVGPAASKMTTIWEFGKAITIKIGGTRKIFLNVTLGCLCSFSRNRIFRLCRMRGGKENGKTFWEMN